MPESRVNEETRVKIKGIAGNTSSIGSKVIEIGINQFLNIIQLKISSLME